MPLRSAFDVTFILEVLFDNTSGGTRRHQRLRGTVNEVEDVTSYLTDVRDQIKTDDTVMKEARRRRDRTLAAAARLPGVRFSYQSGSVAMGVVNNPVNDADGGIVLDRRCYPTLGPDGGGAVPNGVVAELHEHLGPEIRKIWPAATVHDMKRGVTVRFHEPVCGAEDPYVDVVVAMERCGDAGLWIPNLAQGRWEASDPQRHVELMQAGPDDVRRSRARVVRLAKAWNKQFAEPGLSSFNIVALALEAIDSGYRIDVGLHRFFEHAAVSLRSQLTADPANVSASIKTMIRKDIAVSRLEKARDELATAINTDDPGLVAASLHNIFWNYIDEPPTAPSKTSIADYLRTGTPRFLPSAAGLAVGGTTKPYRAFGSR